MGEPSTLPQKVMFVDDEQLPLREHRSALERQGIQVLIAPDLGSALYLFNHNSVDVALVALEFKEISGLAVLQKLRASEAAQRRCAGMILMSKSRERLITDGNLCKELGGIEIIAKPFKTVQLLPYLARVHGKRPAELKFLEFKEKVLDYHRNKGNFSEAVEAVKKKLGELGPRGTEVLLALYEEASKIDEGVALIDDLLARPENSEDIRLINAKARLLLKGGRHQEAAAVLELADQLAPKNIQRIAEMATVYLATNQPDKSVAKMRDLIGLSPEQPEIRFDLFSKLQEHGFDQQAIELCQETTTPGEVVRHYNNLGVMKSKQGDPVGAIKGYEDALRFYPDFGENYRICFNLALGLIKSDLPDRIPRAIEALERALQLEPKYSKAKELLGRLRTAKKAS